MSYDDAHIDLGYFGTTLDLSKISTLPDIGALPITPRLGLSCIGIVPLVLNFNMRFRPEDPRDKVITITKSIREEGLVQALTLQHEGGAYEIACNLLDSRKRSPGDVLTAVNTKCRELGLHVAHSYTTGPSEQDIIDTYLLSSSFVKKCETRTL
jgi:hypothetical protein